jgi:hypothetical protein
LIWLDVSPKGTPTANIIGSIIEHESTPGTDPEEYMDDFAAFCDNDFETEGTHRGLVIPKFLHVTGAPS